MGEASKLCRKRRFPDRWSAELDMQRIQERKGQARVEPKRVYECTRCGGFHMTHRDIEDYERKVEQSGRLQG